MFYHQIQRGPRVFRSTTDPMSDKLRRPKSLKSRKGNSVENGDHPPWFGGWDWVTPIQLSIWKCIDCFFLTVWYGMYIKDIAKNMIYIMSNKWLQSDDYINIDGYRWLYLYILFFVLDGFFFETPVMLWGYERDITNSMICNRIKRNSVFR